MRALVVMASALLAGCGSEEPATVDLGPTGPPSITFENPPSGQGAQCVSVGEAADGQVPLLVAVDEVLLRPPGACGSLLQCGHLELYVEGRLNNEGAVPAIDLLLRKLGDPFHDGSTDQATGEPDVLNVSVQVVDFEGTPLLDEDEEVVSDELQLITVPDCGALDDPAEDS